MAEPALGILRGLQQIIELLPTLFQLIQIISYVIFVFFLGHIAIRGYKGNIKPYLGFLLTVFFGFLSLVAGASIGGFLAGIPPFNNTLFILLQANLIAGGIIAAVVFAAGLYMITYRNPVFRVENIGKAIQVLEERLGRIEAVLLKDNTLRPTVKENEAKSAAEKAMPGYKPETAEFSDGVWNIIMRKGNKMTKAEVDAYTGKVNSVVIKGIDPLKVTGVALIAAFVVFGLLAFRGFPDAGKEMFSLIGISQQELETFGKDIESRIGESEMDPSCVDVATLALNYGPDIINNEIPRYSDENVKNMIERASGEKVNAMYLVTHEGKDVVIAVTDSSLCSATRKIFCQCMSFREGQ